jgi:hypothetical protein
MYPRKSALGHVDVIIKCEIVFQLQRSRWNSPSNSFASDFVTLRG